MQAAPAGTRAGLPHDRVARAEAETPAVIGPLDPARTTHDGKTERTFGEIMTGDLNCLRLDPITQVADIAEHWASAPPRLFQATASAGMIAEYVRAGLAYAGLAAAMDASVAASVEGLRRLVGHVIPLFGRLNKRVDRDGSTRFENYDPSANDNFRAFVGGRDHPTCLNPTILSLYSDAARDQGRVLCLVVPLARQAFNFPHDDARRLVVPGTGASYLDCVTLAVVVHVYDDAFDWNRWAPPPARCRGAAAAAPDDFGWAAYRAANPGVAIRGFGLHRQIQGVSRAMVGPERFGLTVRDAREVLDRVRAAPGGLAAALADLPMNGTGVVRLQEPGRSGRPRAGAGHVCQGELKRRARKEQPSGLDLRTFMLIEMLLAGTGLAPVLAGGAPAFALPARVDVPRFFETLKKP